MSALSSLYAKADASGLPMSLEHEQAILGAMLRLPESRSTIRGMLAVEHFAIDAHRTLYGALCAMIDAGQGIDTPTVGRWLLDRRKLDSVGGLAALADLADLAAFADNVSGYAAIIRERAEQRQLFETLARAAESALDVTRDPEEIRTATLAALSERGRAIPSGFTPRAVMEADYNGFLDPAREYREAVTLPWRKLAALIPGLLPGELVTLAARPSVGKSALAMEVAECAALAGHRVAVFSLEMSARELLRRLVCKRARVDSHKFRLGYADQAERVRLAQAAAEVSELPLVIYGPEVRTAETIAAKVRGEGFRLAVVDHLQLMTGRGDNRVQELAEITGALKILAGRAGLSVLLLSQFSREIEKRGGAPKLSDLRDSGSIEQDSDIVLALHRPRGDDGELIATHVHVLKQRNGPVGMVELAFRRRYVAFEEAA